MGQINIDPDMLDRAASKLTELSKDTSANASRLSGTAGKIEAAWNSQYTADYTEKLLRIRENLNKIAEGSEKLAAALKQMAAATRRTEEENRLLFRE